MSDIEVGSDVSRHPGIVYPEELHLPGCPHYGSGRPGRQNVDPTLQAERGWIVILSRHKRPPR